MFIILRYNLGINTKALCHFCFDGLEAIKMIENSVQKSKITGLNKMEYDLILIDCNMPFLDGYETTLRIRQYLYDNNFI
jgi:CheY-like chemotaxis protein